MKRNKLIFYLLSLMMLISLPSWGDAPVVTAKVTVDNASKVVLTSEATYEAVTLDNGENTIKAGTYYLQPQQSGYTLCSVKLDGSELELSTWGYYYVELAENKQLVITADYTPANSKLTFDGTTAAISSITHSGGQQYNGAPTTALEVANGYTTYLNLNTNAYKIKSVKVNEETISQNMGSYSFTVTTDATVSIDAAEYTKYDVTVAGNTDAVKFYQASSTYDYSPIPCDVVNGKISVSEKTPYVYVKANEGYEISKVLNGETPVNSSYYGYICQTQAGSVITVTAAKQVVSDPTAPKTDADVATQIAKRWKTGFFKFNAQIPENLKVYTITNIENNVITITEQSSIQAWTPYIMEVKGMYSLSGEYVAPDKSKFGTAGLNVATICGNGYLKGAVTTAAINKGYVLQKQAADTESMFHPVTTVITVPESKCFLNYTAPSSGKSGVLSISLEDETATAIQTVKVVRTDGKIYDMSGRELQHMVKGLNIVNGKKILK